jgi:hypothetical protein
MATFPLMPLGTASLPLPKSSRFFLRAKALPNMEAEMVCFPDSLPLISPSELQNDSSMLASSYYLYDRKSLPPLLLWSYPPCVTGQESCICLLMPQLLPLIFLQLTPEQSP